MDKGKWKRCSRGRGIFVLLAGLVFVLGLPLSAGAWSYKEAAKPYTGKPVTILDEVTPLQETMKKLVPDFIKETGIKVDYVILNHFDVINKGQADLLSGTGAYDAILLHSPQMGLILNAGAIRPLDEFMGNPKLASPTLENGDFIQPAWDSTAKFKGKTYGLLTWNYNEIYWTRHDLMNHPAEKEAFKKKYGYNLAPAETMQQMRDIAEFFTRKKGEKLAGETLQSDFYGIVLEGLKSGTTFWDVTYNFMRNWGGNLFDAQGRPTIDSPENIAAVKFWASLWKFSPPGQSEYSLIDIPTLMGNGIAAQTIAWSDFVLGIDQPSKSKLSGKFSYRGIPRNANYSGPRSAEIEPSILAISKNSKNPEATFLFLQWMVEKTTQNKLFQTQGSGVPVRESSWSNPVLAKSRFAELYKAMQASDKVGKGKPAAPKIYEILDVMGGILQEVGLGKKSAEDGMKEGQKKVLELCKECVLK
jgi:multiple sugar transport system substrate-binding protein